jgi:NifU-like N terminal domain
MLFFEEFRELGDERIFEDCDLSAQFGVTYTNPVCGDVATVSVQLNSGIISSFSYKATGCWPVSCCLEFLGRRFLNRSAKSATTYPLAQFLEAVEGVPGSKRHAFSLAHKGLLGAVAKAWSETAELDVMGVGPDMKERV